LFYYFF